MHAAPDFGWRLPATFFISSTKQQNVVIVTAALIRGEPLAQALRLSHPIGKC